MTLPDTVFVSELEYRRVTEPVIQPGFQYYRKPHDVEIIDYDDKNWNYGGDGHRSGPVRGAVINSPENPLQKPMPEVYRVFPDHQTVLSCEWQKFIRDINPELPVDKVITLFDTHFAIMNRTGVPERYTCLSGKPREDGEKDVAFHAPIVMGGALLKGVVQDGLLYLDSLLTSGTVPPAEWVLERPWLWYYGTAVTRTGQINLIMRLGLDGNLHPVRIPILSRLPLYVPVGWLDKLPVGFIPPDATRWMPL